MELLLAILLLILLPLILSCLLLEGPVKQGTRSTNLTTRIDQLLPQTQCGSCSYDGCLPYARAIVAGKADINRCPPGGQQTMRHIAELLGREPRSLDPACGHVMEESVALIDANECIGCVKCIQACPVDAILGAAKQLHTVLPGFCTGCRLCLEPCPVNCISMQAAGTGKKLYSWITPMEYPERQS